MTPARKNQSWLPDVFNDLFDTNWMPRVSATAPAVNVIETPTDYKVELAAPGYTKDDFGIKIDEDNNLIISMEKKEEKKEDNNEKKEEMRYLRREFSYSKYQQAMILPDDVQKDKISAKVEHGVLTVVLPKQSPEDKKKAEQQIEIL
ncbi:MAG: Hsp20/alpha crystallin family protein [Bacteroidaceae bacterium]